MGSTRGMITSLNLTDTEYITVPTISGTVCKVSTWFLFYVGYRYITHIMVDLQVYTGQTDCEQLWSRIKNNGLQDVWSCTYVGICHVHTVLYVFDKPTLSKCPTSISCYWFCYVFAHDQFTRYQQRSNEPLWHHESVYWIVNSRGY